MSDVQVPSPQGTEPAGLDAIIDNAITQSGYGTEDEAPAKAAETPEPTPTEPKIDATGRAHSADGKFATKQPAEAKPSDTEPAKAPETPATPIAAEPAAVQPIEPPSRWSEAEKATFAKWPRDVQEAVAERHKAMEGDYTRKTQELAETRKSIEPLLETVTRANPVFQSMQMAPHEFMAQSLNVVNALRNGSAGQRGEAIAYLVNHHRIPPEAVLQALGVPTPQAGPDGQMTVDPTILQLRQQVTGLERSLQQMGQQEQLRQRQQAEAEFNAIGQAKDEKGTAKFPHFERVRQSMIRLVADGIAENWDQAYSKAVRLDDELHTQVVEQERQRVLAEAEATRQQAVDKAKKATPVRVSSGSPGGAAQTKGLDAHISAAMERSGFGD